MNNELIINFTPTGIIPTKDMTPYVPVTPEEIIEDVSNACELGITIVHLHVRDKNGVPTLDPSIYRDIILEIRKKHDVVICVSLSGRLENNIDKRIAPLLISGKAKPDMGSLTLSSLNFNHTESVNSPSTIISLALKMKELGIVPELEVFDVGMSNYMKYLLKKEILTYPFYVNIILGNVACSQADPLHLGVILHEIDLSKGKWAVGGIGDYQLPMNALAIAIGGGVRVGIEDNIYLDDSRNVCATNLQLLERVHRLSEIHHRKIMSPSSFKKYFGI